MPDDLNPQSVPGQGEEQTPSPAQTSAGSPELPRVPEQPSPFTREEAVSLIRDQLAQFSPEFAQQIRQAFAQDFATKNEVTEVSRTAAQRAADKTYATMMKRLSPELRGIDKAVKAGMIDPAVGDQAKMKLLTDAAGELESEPAEEDHKANVPSAPAPFQQPYLPPQPDLRQETQKAAVQLLGDAKLTWEDVRDDMLAFRRTRGRDMGLGEFNVLVASKVSERQTKGKETDWMKKYESERNRVKGSDAAGATTPPPSGTAPEYKPKATLDDAADVGDVMAERFGLVPKK